jgi:hypothetical protein
MRIFHWLVAISAIAVVAAGCRTPEQAAAPEADVPIPVGTLREVMHGIIEYNAFKIFDAVAVTVTAEGITEKEPRTEEEWDEVLHAALGLAEAPNLLVNVGHDGRTIAFPQDMDTSAGEGELTPNQIQARIDEKKELWLKYLNQLQSVGRETMDIVNKKNVSGLFEIGEKIDRVCETCHMEFWYPEAPPQP